MTRAICTFCILLTLSACQISPGDFFAENAKNGFHITVIRIPF